MQFTVDFGTIVTTTLITVCMGLTGIVYALARESIKQGDARTIERLEDRLVEYNLRVTRLEQDYIVHSETLKSFQAFLHRIELQLTSINSKLSSPTFHVHKPNTEQVN